MPLAMQPVGGEHRRAGRPRRAPWWTAMGAILQSMSTDAIVIRCTPDRWQVKTAADRPVGAGQRPAGRGSARAAGGPPGPPGRAVRDQRQPGPGGAQPDGGRRVRRPPTGPGGTGWPGTCSTAWAPGATAGPGETRPWAGAWRLVVVTTSGQFGRGARRPAARRLALARLAEQREGVWLRPDNIDLVPDPADDPDLTVFTGHPRRGPGGAGRRAVGPRGVGGARPASSLDRLGRLAHPGRTTWPRASSCPPPCSATSRPTRCFPSELLPADWPGPGCATPTTVGPAVPRWC